MEHGIVNTVTHQTESFDRTSSADSSLRRRSLSLSHTLPFHIVDDIESENVSEAGDIGDRALSSKRHSESGSIRVSIDSALEKGAVFPIHDDNLLESHVFKFHDSTASNTFPGPPLPEEIINPLSTDAVVSSMDEQQDKKVAIVLPPTLEYISCLLYLSVFGIFGVLTRYVLQKLFGPSVAGVTSDHYPLYLDLPSNMVGSFLMGWCGVVFKNNIARMSDHLAIGITTGYLGSLTTFSGWNQKMLDLLVDGHWVFAVVGFLVGLFLAAYSIKFGIGTAKCFKSLLKISNKSETNTSSNWRVDSCRRHLTVIGALVLMLGVLWSVSGTMLKEEFNSGSSEAQLWLACLVAAPGVWIRWFLARLNGRGLGKSVYVKWVPFGTLIANVSAACIMAALATLKKAVNTKTCNTISTGIQLGFLGCLSTVSTFIAEYNAMEESNKMWRAYAYALATILMSFGLGILIYAVPVWTRGYE
ncbi:fluoride export protein 1-like [Mercurialis annua]|uniref:fluoride export protein 1-like n=1 Tax=Mercurialis annua TaxID=3986 RepID=UPI00215E8920|nr:fluoride export protein 1-like [Mercurialis annua]XP_050212392.1 fluoride export protein 1-like [Mercurialis annua]